MPLEGSGAWRRPGECEAQGYALKSVVSKLLYRGSIMDWLAGLADWATVGISAGCAIGAALITAAAMREGVRKKHRLEDQTETVLRRLLEVGAPKYPERLRSFASLKARVPLSDDKLVEALLRAGAIQCERRDGSEKLWGLAEYHPDKL